MHRVKTISLAALVFLLPAAVAFAAAPPGAMPAPASTDLSMQLLSAIFGSTAVADASNFVFGAPAGAGAASGLLASMMQVLNTSLTGVAALIVLIGVVNGVIHTAHDGQVGGQKYSTFWGPARAVLSIGALMPVISGYSLIQVVMLALTIQGIAIANAVQTAAASALTGAGGNVIANTSLSPIPPPSYLTKRLARVLLDDLTCFETANAVTSASGLSAWMQQFDSGASAGGTETISWGRAGAPQECGSVTVSLPSTTIGTVAAGLGLGATQAVAARQAIVGAQGAGLQAMIVDLTPAADTLATAAVTRNASVSLSPALLTTAGTAYTNALSSALAGIAITTASASGTAGWLAAGASYYAAANVSRAAQEAMMMAPEPSMPSPVAEEKATFAPVAAAVSAADNWASADGAPDVVPAALSAVASWGSDAWSLATRVFGHPISTGENIATGQAASHLLTAGILTWFQSALTGPGDPLAALQSVGNIMIYAALGPGIILAAATAGAAIPLAIGLLIAGAGLAVVLPLMPALIWLMAAIGWVIMAIELVAVCPFLLAMNAQPSGEGWAATASIRAELLGAFGVVSRPALMVVGLYAALLVMRCAAWLSGQLLAPMVQAALAGDGNQGLIISAALLIVLAGLLIAIAYESAKLITRIPDYALRLFGGSAAPTDPTAGWQRIQGITSAAGAMMTGALGSIAGKQMEQKALTSGGGGGGGGSSPGTAGGSGGGGGSAPRMIEFAETAASAPEDAGPPPVVSTRILGPLGGTHPTSKI